MLTIVLHIQNEDAVLGEMEALPTMQDTMVTVKHPRRRDGKDLIYLDANVTTVIWPISRINFIEIMPSAEEEEIIGFIRE